MGNQGQIVYMFKEGGVRFVSSIQEDGRVTGASVHLDDAKVLTPKRASEVLSKAQGQFKGMALIVEALQSYVEAIEEMARFYGSRTE